MEFYEGAAFLRLRAASRPRPLRSWTRLVPLVLAVRAVWYFRCLQVHTGFGQGPIRHCAPRRIKLNLKLELFFKEAKGASPRSSD